MAGLTAVICVGMLIVAERIERRALRNATVLMNETGVGKYRLTLPCGRCGVSICMEKRPGC